MIRKIRIFEVLNLGLGLLGLSVKEEGKGNRSSKPLLIASIDDGYAFSMISFAWFRIREIDEVENLKLMVMVKWRFSGTEKEEENRKQILPNCHIY
jgi:hypothetical protein